NDRVDRAAVVVDVKPLSSICARAIDRQRSLVERLRDEFGDRFLWVLIWPEVVRADTDRDRNLPSLVIRADDHVRGGLARVVRRLWPVGRRLSEHLRTVEREIAVHLARTNVVKARRVALPRGFE